MIFAVHCVRSRIAASTTIKGAVLISGPGIIGHLPLSFSGRRIDFHGIAVKRIDLIEQDNWNHVSIARIGILNALYEFIPSGRIGQSQSIARDSVVVVKCLGEEGERPPLASLYPPTCPPNPTTKDPVSSTRPLSQIEPRSLTGCTQQK
jgi:hypothetical protein